jgi:hypothetical protein
MKRTPFNYSNRDFISIVNDIDSDSELRESPPWWKYMLAGMFDVLSNVLNAIYNTLFIRTAYDRTILQDVLSLIDYQLDWKSTSSTILTINVDAAATSSNDYTINKDDLIFQTEITGSEPLRFEARDDVTFSQSTTQTSITVYQQTTKDSINIGQTDGSNFQQLEMPDVDVLKDEFTLLIGADTYTRVNNFSNSLATDKVFRLYFRSDGSSYIVLGGANNVGTQFGFIPTANQTVYASYLVGGGSNTNVGAGTITDYIGTDQYFTTCTNPSNATGGRDAEKISEAKNNAIVAARNTGYFINKSTGEALAKEVDGVLFAQVEKNGLLGANVWIIPSGGGSPTVQLKEDVKDYLEARSPLESVEVTVNDPNYQPVTYRIRVKVFEGYTFSDVQKYIQTAIILRFHELGFDIQNTYDSLGVNDAIDQINSYSLLTTNLNKTTDVSQVIKLLDSIPFINFNEWIRVPYDIDSAINFVDGIDYIKILTPSSDVSMDNGYISSITSILVEEITS